MNKYLSVRETANLLQVSPASVYGMVGRGILRHVRVGSGRGVIRIPESAIGELNRVVDTRPTVPPLPPSPQILRTPLRHLRL